MSRYTYKCPKEDKCVLKKHCHVITTSQEILQPIPVFKKCPAKNNKEILIYIGKQFNMPK